MSSISHHCKHVRSLVEAYAHAVIMQKFMKPHLLGEFQEVLTCTGLCSCIHARSMVLYCVQVGVDATSGHHGISVAVDNRASQRSAEDTHGRSIPQHVGEQPGT